LISDNITRDAPAADAGRVITEVFIPVFAVHTIAAGYALVERDPISDCEMMGAVCDFRNDPRQLMSQVRRKLAHALAVQKVFDICAANRTCLHFDNNATVRTFRHIHLHNFHLAGTLKHGFFYFHNASLNKKLVIAVFVLIP
jgi:hypothetical protein